MEILAEGDHLILLLDVSAAEMDKCIADPEFAREFLKTKFAELLEEMLEELPQMESVGTKVKFKTAKDIN
jgi:hypothetical protein